MPVPYTKSPGSIPRLLNHIKSAGIPPKVTVKYLKSVGFTSSNDTYLIGLLKGIDFIGASGSPTERWKAYRGVNGRKALADAIRVGYPELFATYPDAHQRDNEAIANFIRGHTDYSADTVSRALGTFKALCQEADFEAGEASSTPEDANDVVQHPLNGGLPVLAPAVTAASAGPTVHINIELHLPPSTDGSVYDAFFKAMKEHLFD